MGILENNTENFSVIPMKQNAFEKAKAYARLLPGIECYGLMISPIDKNDGIVYDVILAQDQVVSGGDVNVDSMAALAMEAEVKGMGYKPIGFWHSHGNFGVCHSGIDKHNMDSLLLSFASYNEEKELFEQKLKRGYFPDGNSITVRFDGQDYVFRMANDDTSLRADKQGKLYPELVYGFSKEHGFFINTGEQTVILKEPVNFMKTGMNGLAKSTYGVGYSLVVNTAGNYYAQIGRSHFCHSCDHSEIELNDGKVKIIKDDNDAAKAEANFSDDELVADLEKRIKNYDDIKNYVKASRRGNSNGGFRHKG